MLCSFSTFAVNDSGAKPVMIIRFNHPDVSFSKPLSLLAKKALLVDSKMIFNLVSLSSGAEDKINAMRDVNAVKDALIENGVASNQIHISFQEDQQISNNEIYIYTELNG
jgi:hypothetical protein